MDADQTLERIGEVGLIAVVRGSSRAAALEVSTTLIENGVEGIEITYTTPEAQSVVEDLGQEYGDRILLGAGTVTSPEQVEMSVAAGATFMVSPGCNTELVLLMQETKLAVVPGTLTPSDIMTAQNLEIETIKLFPGSLGGSSYLQSLRGPFPNISFIPTGGVSLDNLDEWFEAGAYAVGVGGALAPTEIRNDFEKERVAEQARHFVKTVKASSQRR